ncbi:MAG TPA: hypothetical protein VFH74_03295 [Gaiellales bacterium]|nr:hypothetical protein [Gaiellales bacterium]
MGRARRSTARIGIWLALAAVMAAALTVTAYALTRGSKHPPKRSLAAAIHHAMASKPVAGVSADFTVSQHLLPGTSSLLDSSPLAGAQGSVWASGDRARLVVRSQLGTAQVGLDGHTVTLYLPKQHAAYRLALPKGHADAKPHESGTPSLAEIRHTLSELGRTLNISGAIAGNVAGQPAYTVRISSRHDSGLIGPLAVAFDAAHGTPLRVALYPRGSSTPAIALQVSHIHYGAVPASQTALKLPSGTHVTRVHLPSKAEITHAMTHAQRSTHSSAAAVTSAAPASLAGMPRTAARELSSAKAGNGLLAVYGHGLGAVVVIEHAMTGGRSHAGAPSSSSMLPSVRINGARGNILQTTLGTIVTFDRGGKQFVVLGARPVSTILAAARALP